MKIALQANIASVTWAASFTAFTMIILQKKIRHKLIWWFVTNNEILLLLIKMLMNCSRVSFPWQMNSVIIAATCNHLHLLDNIVRSYPVPWVILWKRKISHKNKTFFFLNKLLESMNKLLLLRSSTDHLSTSKILKNFSTKKCQYESWIKF
jgi:hypothetical protein